MNLGYLGGTVVTDTTAVTGTFRAILVLADVTFTTLTNDLTKNGTATLSAAADFGTILAGVVLYGNFTAVTLASGKVILYK